MSEETLTTPELLHIPLDQIEENPRSLRKVDTDGDEFKDLVEDIKRNGVILPVAVRRVDGADDRFLIVDGLHRYTGNALVYNETGEERFATIPAIVRPAGEADDVDDLELQISANLQGAETKPVQYARALHTIMRAHPERTLVDQADRLSKSTGWLRSMLSLTTLSEDAAKLVDTGDIKLQNAYELAKLPPEEQAPFLDKAKDIEHKNFAPLIKGKLKALRADKSGGQTSSAPVYRLRKKDEVATSYESTKTAAESDNAGEYEKGYAAALAWVLRIDSTSQAQDETTPEKGEE